MNRSKASSITSNPDKTQEDKWMYATLTAFCKI